MNMRVLILLSIITLTTACNNGTPDLDGNNNDLVGTVWSKNRVELYSSNSGELVNTYFPNSCEQEELILFDKRNRIIRQDYCYSNDSLNYDCGQWTIAAGELEVVIGIGKIVPGICATSNSSEVISFKDSITFTGDGLVLPTTGIDDPNQYLTRDTIADITQGIYFVRTYYDLSDQEVEVPDDDDCCSE